MRKMTENTPLNECVDPTQSLTIKLPCALVERCEKHARKHDINLDNVIIEALDSFLRHQD